MPLLIASIGALLSGPVIFRFARTRRWTLSLLDGFIFVAITGLVLLYILPGTVKAAGWIAIAAALIGMFGPSFSERLFHRKAEEAHLTALVLALSGIVLHSFVDGAALADPGQGHAHDHNSLLPTAIILHQIPVSLAIWWLLRPIYGFSAAMAVLVAVGGAIVAGYGFGPYFLATLSGSGIGLFEAFVAGSLLHVVFHQPHAGQGATDGVLTVTAPALGKRRWHEGVGALMGILLLFLFLGQPPAEEPLAGSASPGVGATFVSLALESAPALLIAYLLAGLLNSFLPASSIGWLGKGARWKQSFKGMAIGLPFPICSCGVVPIYRTLIQRGAPPAAAVAFLVSTPELGLDAVLISIPLLGGEMTMIRIAAAGLTAFLIGWLVGGMMKSSARNLESDASSEPASAIEPSLAEKLRSAVRVGFGEVVDHTAPWILAGLAVAAALQPFLRGSWLTALPSGLEVPMFALLGLPAYVCASGATPLVAVLMAAGVSPGAALAFLLTGPATNVTTFGLLAQLHGRPAALRFSGGIIAVSVSLGFAVNALFPGAGEVPFEPAAAEEYASWQIAAALVLAGVYLASLLRRGARRFCAELLLENRRAIDSHPHS